ncbi:GNAT family N-acetyltransferase [Halomonas sp. G11]|uniref:GNAT family N-acetyltransferase n=1 Tax=Halomonas sp. G11 TaxID=1684425 RepID=UPI001F1C6C10|nr:GNAT family N-acetyltransferase [Halomonas sp. G11]
MAPSTKPLPSESFINALQYLLRNLGLRFVAEVEGQLIGTIMAGHDGKRGYVQHLSVADSHRRKGIATQLVSLCLKLREAD